MINQPATTSEGGSPRRPLRTTLIAAATVLVLAGMGGGVYWGLQNMGEGAPLPTAVASAQAPTPSVTSPAETGRVTVSAMGDMLPHDSVNANALKSDGTYDYGQFFQKISPLYESSDLVFCNQEVPSGGKDFGITGYPTFNAPTDFARDLRQAAKCDTINLANNHMADRGQDAINATLDVWDGLDAQMVSGANRSAEEQQNNIAYAEVKGVRVAFVAFAEYNNAGGESFNVNLFGNTAVFERLVKTARQNADIVMVSMHWGTENTTQIDGPQRDYSKRLADMGVDVVIGTGPHVLQETTWLDRPDGGKTLVWYSIGNMLSTQLELDQLTGGVAQFDIEGNKPDGYRVTNPRFIPTYMSYEWSAADQAAQNLSARKNLMIYPLKDAEGALSASNFQASVSERKQAVQTALGPAVTLVE
ncbi:CapA family protein [Lysinibacter sp. HNR]|uniref:CapA family protein n=1 Tax=Lysinibacter sp. HNR TaxID=3031408 RepID=UPI002435445F|nr:CapA family protein [Lysinibacter sp. HNR]WGD37162.1 CapA family protein [Lysinibacter sp. HNR]